jgi:hypothetical protein
VAVHDGVGCSARVAVFAGLASEGDGAAMDGPSAVFVGEAAGAAGEQAARVKRTAKTGIRLR